jgi:hypothetical protein
MKLASFVLSAVYAKLSPFQDDILYDIKFVGEEVNLEIPNVKYDEEDFIMYGLKKEQLGKVLLKSTVKFFKK